MKSALLCTPERRWSAVLTSLAATGLALGLGLGLAACGSWISAAPTRAGAGLDRYPPMAAGVAPGASPEAMAMARSLGRGINFGNMLESPQEGDWGLRVEDRFIDLVGTAGFPTTVRLPVRWSNHAGLDAAARIDPAFMARVADVVDKLLAHGATVVLDMHHYRQFDGDVLDPGESAVDPAVVDLRFLALWQQIAQRFASHGPRLLFEIYNEPHGRLDTRWNDLLSRAMRVIRASNPKRPLVVGPVLWNSPAALPRLVLPADRHLILTVHHYEPFDFTHQGAEWAVPTQPIGVDCCNPTQRALMERLLDQAVRESARLGYPVFVGEFGAYGKAAAAARITYTRAMRDAMEARGLPWMYWELAAGFGVYDPAAGQMRADLATALFGS
jgi:endoglucanase